MNQVAPLPTGALEAKPVKGVDADYRQAEWSGEDTSGLECVGVTVLVKVDTPTGKTSGDIHLPDHMVWQHAQAAETGVIVAVGTSAFRLNNDGSTWTGPKPSPGTRVIIEKFAGTFVRGVDGYLYRLMPYGCVLASFKPGKKAV